MNSNELVPRSPKETLAGFVHIPRLLDKARAYKKDSLGDYIYQCPIDKEVLTFLGLNGDEFAKKAEEADDDFLLKTFKTEEIIGCIDKPLSLEWERKNKDLSSLSNITQKQNLSNLQLPDKLYVSLKNSVEDFNLTQYSEALKDLEQMGMDGKRLANKLNEYLKTYDFISIQQVLEKINKNG